MRHRRAKLALAGFFLLPACSPQGAPVREEGNKQAAAEPETIEIPQTVTELAPGTTPMNERVAVLGLLNKRNGISRDLTLQPGQAVRIDDVLVRLLACETTAPWEEQELTGAFVQLDVRNRQNREQYNRVFSGWLYKESPSLNVVEHPIWDVWPKSCAMTHPGGSEEESDEAAANNASSAAQSTPGASRTPARPAPGDTSANAAESSTR